ncbi:hypothetical protein DFH11DRAFT_1859633 [Phellopilus nigrolimitatus]|nr:hypothetical protein DFH11DRAFT_1859633 [Phellopilus nigrolimitatus]
MVVTRRTSVPMPPTSRTPSSQTAPKINKGKAPQTSSLAREVDVSFSNGAAMHDADYSGPQFSDDVLFSDGSPPRKISKDRSKGKLKKKEKARPRKKRPSSWLDLFSRMFILAFLIYSLSVCPTDKQQSLVCRGLSEYRRVILEPYVITPFQNLLQHPSVFPYAVPVINAAKPVVSRSQKEWNTRVVPQWNARVVPQWKEHVVPLWNTRVSPYIARLDAKVGPYRQTVGKTYSRNVAPYVAYAQRVVHRSQPYILLTVAKSYDTYQSSRPYLVRGYKQLQRVPPLFVKYVLKPLAVARRQFVDPHVALLVEKIKELSAGTAKTPTGESVDDKITPAPAVSPKTQVDAEEASGPAEIELPPVPQATQYDDTLASASSVVSASVFLGTRITESVPGATYSPVPELEHEEEIAPSSVPELAATFSSFAVPEATEAVEDPVSLSSDVVAPKESGATAVPSINVPKAHRPEQPIHSPAVEDTKISSDDDLDGFLDGLGLDVDETVTTSGTLEVEPSPSAVEETEEEKAVREAALLAEVAEKRRNLQARHTKWEEKLQAVITAQTAALRKALSSIRKSAAAELKANATIRDAVETLHVEAEKALRGTDAYFAKLKKEGKARDEKVRLWDRVLVKVEAKFDERVRAMEEMVNTWYQEEVEAKEAQEIEKGSTAVKAIADNAQTDMGLDYAWLEDVTYKDWRRYHALLERHQAWLDEANSIINGSHASPVANAVEDVVDDLRAEVQDITVGFETRLRRMKREGDRAFTSDESSEPDALEPEVSVLPVAEAGSPQGKSDEKVLGEVSDAILGRSSDEVVAALGLADSKLDSKPEAEAKNAHEEL